MVKFSMELSDRLLMMSWTCQEESVCMDILRQYLLCPKALGLLKKIRSSQAAA